MQTRPFRQGKRTCCCQLCTFPSQAATANVLICSLPPRLSQTVFIRTQRTGGGFARPWTAPPRDGNQAVTSAQADEHSRQAGERRESPPAPIAAASRGLGDTPALPRSSQRSPPPRVPLPAAPGASPGPAQPCPALPGPAEAVGGSCGRGINRRPLPPVPLSPLDGGERSGAALRSGRRLRLPLSSGEPGAAGHGRAACGCRGLARSHGGSGGSLRRASPLSARGRRAALPARPPPSPLCAPAGGGAARRPP